MLNSVKYEVAHKNKAMAFRHGVEGRMMLPCATFMDDKTSEYLNTIDYCGVGEKRGLGASVEAVKRDLKEQRRRRLQLPENPWEVEEEDDSKSMLEFRRHFQKRQKMAISNERKKASLSDRFLDWKQQMREKYINYDYE
jgi:hypothetical protein